MLQLVIGNKHYSSWSMRPWVLLRQFAIAFDEIKLRFDRLTYAPESAFYRALAQYTPVAKVPVLLIDGFAPVDAALPLEFERVERIGPDLKVEARVHGDH